VVFDPFWTLFGPPKITFWTFWGHLFVTFWTFLDPFLSLFGDFLRGGGSKPRNTFYILRGFSGGSLELQYRVFFDPFLTFFHFWTSFCHFFVILGVLFCHFWTPFCHFLMTFCHFGSTFLYEKWISEVVGSARSQLFIPGFRHAHTLQQPKSVFWTLTPGRVFKKTMQL